MTRTRLLLVAVALAAAGSACGGSSEEPGATATTVATTSAPETTVEVPRPGMPTVPVEDERDIPRASTREAVIEGRPAVIVTLPETVLFDFGKAELRTDAEPSLQGIVDLVGDNPGADTEVQGHTDSVGDAAFNQALSEQRASAVAEWLADHGVDSDTLTTNGYGSSQPVADNDTPEGRQQNRRVEVVVRLAP